MSFNRPAAHGNSDTPVFSTLREAQVLIEEWRRHYNRVRPHSALGYRPPAPETVPLARSPSSSGAGAANHGDLLPENWIAVGWSFPF